MRDLKYSVVSTVISSWDECKRSPNYNEQWLETMVLLKLFELEPRTKRVFGLNEQCSAVEFVQSGKLTRGIGIIRMLDGALCMLGPDTDTLVEILEDVGKRHVQYGVEAQHYLSFGKAILFALSEIMGDKWNKTMDDAWQAIYGELAGEMIRATLLHRK